MDIQLAYRICEEVVKYHSSSFYRAFSVMPVNQRNAVWAIYAFCRTVDDIVDESTGDAEPLVDQFQAAFTNFVEGHTDPHPHWIALRDVFNRYPMNPEPFYQMIAGQRSDLTHHRIANIQEFEHYCYLVAGTVGLMLLPVLTGMEHKTMAQEAIKLGIAMQITNVLRDVKEDYKRGRIYLPYDMMEVYGFKEVDIPLGVKAPGWKPLFDQLSDRAEQLYQEGLAAGTYYPRRSRISLHAAGLIYREILVESRRRSGDVYTERVRISNARKLRIMIGLVIQPSTWRKAIPPASHSQTNTNSTSSKESSKSLSW